MAMFSALFIGLVPVVQLGPLTPVDSWAAGLRSPARIAVASDGTVLVTDPFNDHIARFDAAGTPLGTWPVTDGPIGIAAHPDGRYFVTLRDQANVAIYDNSFNQIGFLGEGNPLVTFVKPTDIDVATDTGRIYVVDAGGDKVYGFEANGDLAIMMGMRGGASGEFRYPSALTVDEARGRLIVADHDNFRVQIFSTNGMFERRFGYRIKYVPGGGEEGWTVRTLGLATDADGRIYVADAIMSTVRIFDSTGWELGKVVEYGYGPGAIRNPCDLALSNDGTRLYVVSTNTASIEVYETPTFAARGTGSVELAGPEAGPPGTNFSAQDVMYRSRRSTAGKEEGSRKVRRQTRSGANTTGTKTAEVSGEDDTAAAAQTGYEPPHVIDAANICGRCHDIDGQPGGYLGLVEGQRVLCMSCHLAGGQALEKPMHELDLADPFATNPDAADGRGRSHAWGVPAVSTAADSVGPLAGSPMDLHLDNGKIKCTTCHNQHNSEAGSSYLRISNAGDAMCKQCHAPRDKGPGEGGTHPVGFDYPGGVGEFPADATLTPLQLKDAKVECTTCHAVHDADSGGANDGEGDGMLLRDANDETLCKICHTNHIGHTPGGSWQPTCRDCHGVHDPANTNLSLVSATVHNQTLTQDKPVVFSAREGANSFDDGDPAENDGICQVCHTATTYHKHDGTGAPHNDGVDCTTCHPHDAGFMPTGGDCTSCHSSVMDNGDGVPVGGRRPVVGEFPESDAHAHYGAELDNDACTVCHDQATHMDGYVDLIDPDGGPAYRFIRPWSYTINPGDPDLSDFCGACHDSDGATAHASPFDPFGTGGAPPDIASKLLGTLQWDEWYGDWCFSEEGTSRQVNSHHDINDSDQAWSGARIECLSCHGAHAAGSSQPVIDPFVTSTPWTGTMNDFCLECHSGGYGPDDPGFPPGVEGPSVPLRGIDSCDYQDPMWYVDHSWTHSVHGPDSKRGWNGYSGAPGAEVDCMACHDPHGSVTATNPLGNPYMIRDAVDGTMYVDDGVRPGGQWTGPPWDTYGTSREVVVSINGISVDWGGATGLCNVCHADWLTAYDWHSYCTGCQTCHGHGMAWMNYDWVDYDDHTPCPGNNTCGRSGRVAIAEFVTGNTTAADDDDIPACGSVEPSSGIWYSVIGTGNTLTASTCLPGTAFDTSIQVFCDCELLGCVGGNDDDLSCGTSTTSSSFSWCSDPDQVYEIYVGGSLGDFGVFEFAVADDGAACGSPPGCPADLGACCSDVVCEETDAHAECIALGGTGWYLEGDCATFVCPAPAPRSGLIDPHRQAEPVSLPEAPSTWAPDGVEGSLPPIHQAKPGRSGDGDP